MKPKLIILNGPCGIGKSTIAEMYINEHPMTLNLDIDYLWAMMGQWRANLKQSTVQKMKYAHILSERHLLDGFDVIIPNLLRAPEITHFVTIAEQCGAVACELMLITDMDSSLKRFVRRGQAEGNASGFRPGGILESAGGLSRLAQMYDELQITLLNRPNTIVIDSVDGDIEQTYTLVNQYLTGA